MEQCEEESLFDQGEIEIDESVFGASRVRGKRDRDTHSKTTMFA